MTEDEMVGWHHHEFELALGVGDGQGSLACCSPWGLKELYATEKLNSRSCPIQLRLFTFIPNHSVVSNSLQPHGL